MEIIVNQCNLQISEIKDFNQKVRAILIDGENILVANYGDVLLLPGGSIDKDESIEQALLRELKEEIGIPYKYSDFDYLATISFYQKDYPNRNGSYSNRLIKTHYFVGPYLGIQKQTLTEKEKKDNFKLELIPINELENNVLNNQTNNPRNIFFQQELLEILKAYKEKYPPLQASNQKVKK